MRLRPGNFESLEKMPGVFKEVLKAHQDFSDDYTRNAVLTLKEMLNRILRMDPSAMPLL